MDKPKKFYRRRFLNKPGFQTSAHLITKVSCSKDSWEDDKGKRHVSRNVSTQFRIADCYRIIDLEFGAWTDNGKIPAEVKNNREKALKLHREVNDFVLAYLKALDWMAEVGEDE